MAAACTWTKTHLRLQVWNLVAIGKQIMREADCKRLAEKPEGIFRQDKAACSLEQAVFVYMEKRMPTSAEKPMNTIGCSFFVFFTLLVSSHSTTARISPL